MRVVRIRTLDDGGPLAVDLTYRSRFPAGATAVNRIERDGRLLTEYMNFFQPGEMSGIVSTPDDEVTLDRRRAFRDRGWGLRKHEGAPGRGLVFMVAAEFDECSLYLFAYENARGERMLTNGWLIDASGARDTVAELTHDLTITDGVLAEGHWFLRMTGGPSLELRGHMVDGLHLAVVGYRRGGHEGIEGHRSYDLSDPRVSAELSGQTDYPTQFLLGAVGAPDRLGYGICELGLGSHTRYRPDPS
jgi:hypothetical protein